MQETTNIVNAFSKTSVMIKNDIRWLKSMALGKRLGCHQMPERSFFYKKYQFPVCARCTGVLISSAISCAVFSFWRLDWKWCVLLCAAMFMDWLIQRIGIKESTNIRRLLTGLLGGYGFMTLQLNVYSMAAKCIENIVGLGGV